MPRYRYPELALLAMAALWAIVSLALPTMATRLLANGYCLATSEHATQRTGGGDKEDMLFGGADRDDIYGGNGSDLLGGGENDDILRGDDGEDTLFGGFGDDALDGGSDADTLYGDDGVDEEDGGNDFLYDNDDTGGDTLIGEGGDDFIWSNDGPFAGDTLDGGSGTNTEWPSGTDSSTNFTPPVGTGTGPGAAFTTPSDPFLDYVYPIPANLATDDFYGPTGHAGPRSP